MACLRLAARITVALKLTHAVSGMICADPDSPLCHTYKDQSLTMIQKEISVQVASEPAKAPAKQEPTRAPTPPPTPFNAKCACVGNSYGAGDMRVAIEDDGVTALHSFPADLGTACNIWELGNHPSCDANDADAPDWCTQPWCYVDPCDCDLEVLPKVSGYFPEGEYKGMTMYYSYATCGGEDSWTTAESDGACINQDNQQDCEAQEDCAWGDVRGVTKCGGKELVATCANPPESGEDDGAADCPCVGFSGMDGEVMAQIDGNMVPYPSDLGSSCKAWDAESTPSCQVGEGEEPASWCLDKWCWVDPCNCKLPDPPVTSSYFPYPENSFAGWRPIYYSYGTCGSEDQWTGSSHDAACVNQESADDCATLDKCAWNGSECLGKELVDLCPSTESDA